MMFNRALLFCVVAFVGLGRVPDGAAAMANVGLVPDYEADSC